MGVLEVSSDESHSFRFDKHSSALHFDFISVGPREESSVHDFAVGQNEYARGLLIRSRAQFCAAILSNTESLYYAGENH